MQKILDELKSVGISLSDLARASGVSHQYLSELKRDGKSSKFAVLLEAAIEGIQEGTERAKQMLEDLEN